MYPVLFRLGPLTFHTYGLMIALGILLGLWVAVRLAVRDGAPPAQARDAVHGLVTYFVIGGLLGGRLAYIVNYPADFSGHWMSVFKIWEGGLVSYGGLVGALAGFALWHRNHPLFPWRRVLDWLAPAIPLGHAIGRLGCFAAGCCYGRPTNLPWAVTFTNPESLAPLFVPLHPDQLYESAMLVVLGLFLLYRFRKSRGRPEGALFVDYLLLYSVGRFGTDFFRDDPGMAGLTWGQWMSLAVFAAAVALRAGLVPALFRRKTD